MTNTTRKNQTGELHGPGTGVSGGQFATHTGGAGDTDTDLVPNPDATVDWFTGRPPKTLEQTRAKIAAADQEAGPFWHESIADGKQYQAERFGPRWNGWASPMVTRDTLDQVVADLVQEKNPDGSTYTHRWLPDGTSELVSSEYPDEPYTIHPSSDGLYGLGEWGFTFEKPIPGGDEPDLKGMARDGVIGGRQVVVFDGSTGGTVDGAVLRFSSPSGASMVLGPVVQDPDTGQVGWIDSGDEQADVESYWNVTDPQGWDTGIGMRHHYHSRDEFLAEAQRQIRHVRETGEKAPTMLLPDTGYRYPVEHVVPEGREGAGRIVTRDTMEQVLRDVEFADPDAHYEFQPDGTLQVWLYDGESKGTIRPRWAWVGEYRFEDLNMDIHDDDA